jgi:hypothetical protein
VGELQMDWLRSEDLKEEKVVTASFFIIAVRRPGITGPSQAAGGAAITSSLGSGDVNSIV